MRYENAVQVNQQSRFKNEVDETIARLVLTVDPPELRDALHHATKGGKRVRAMLALLSCSAGGGKALDALPAAAAIELLHTSSLIHDDIMDAALMRRGVPSTHSLYGTPMAILAGDTLIALAFRLMNESSYPEKNRVLKRFATAFFHICEGQGFDLVLGSRGMSAVRHHTTMVEKKTAKLMEASAAIGSLIGSTNEDYLRALEEFGYNVGMAFQAKDDLLDASGDECKLGKPVRADQTNGKVTFLTLVSTEAIGKDGTAVGAGHYLEAYTARARNLLNGLPPSPAREGLRALADSLLTREQ